MWTLFWSLQSYFIKIIDFLKVSKQPSKKLLVLKKYKHLISHINKKKLRAALRASAPFSWSSI